MMHRLRPGILDNLGLVEALKDEIAAWDTRSAHTEYVFNYSGELHALGERINITLYRVVQECLTNISKHASANMVKITLVNDNKKILLTVADDGVGFEKNFSSNRLGLIGIRERVKSLSGQLEIESAPGKGVVITIKIPVIQS